MSIPQWTRSLSSTNTCTRRATTSQVHCTGSYGLNQDSTHPSTHPWHGSRIPAWDQLSPPWYPPRSHGTNLTIHGWHCLNANLWLINNAYYLPPPWPLHPPYHISSTGCCSSPQTAAWCQKHAVCAEQHSIICPRWPLCAKACGATVTKGGQVNVCPQRTMC